MSHDFCRRPVFYLMWPEGNLTKRPLIPFKYLKEEFEARTDLLRILSTIAKNHSQTLGLALFRFGEARKACRK